MNQEIVKTTRTTPEHKASQSQKIHIRFSIFINNSPTAFGFLTLKSCDFKQKTIQIAKFPVCIEEYPRVFIRVKIMALLHLL